MKQREANELQYLQSYAEMQKPGRSLTGSSHHPVVKTEIQLFLIILLAPPPQPERGFLSYFQNHTSSSGNQKSQEIAYDQVIHIEKGYSILLLLAYKARSRIHMTVAIKVTPSFQNSPILTTLSFISFSSISIHIFKLTIDLFR